MSVTKKITITAAMLAMGVLLPLAFHMIPNAGSIFAPMHLPTIICGFICGPFYGALIGLLSPLLSFLFMGMPIVAVLPGMMIELFMYGLVSGFLFRVIHTKWLTLDIFISLITSMLIGRGFGGLTNYLLYAFGRFDMTYSWSKFFTAYFVISWPAWLIQLLLIPALLLALTKAKFLREEDRLSPFQKKSIQEKQSSFFDGLAPKWGEERIFSKEKLESLFAPISLKEGERVLDIGCGCGVLEPYLVEQRVIVDAIDLSPKMIEEAKKKSESENVNYAVADFFSYKNEKYDILLVFDAYPHFLNKRRFALHGASLLKTGGSIWIFFDCPKEEINDCHKGTPKGISGPLRSYEEEAKPFLSCGFALGYHHEGNDGYYLQLLKK
mgnify:CR=1 FL=1